MPVSAAPFLMPVSYARFCCTVLLIGNTVVKYRKVKALPVSNARSHFEMFKPEKLLLP